ncbi:diguanylate cyclase [Alteromonadaceae bacterium BrNp21-10]|nr:diguanylate cyclase [Alteromonadaceae bacterium BrNp21-10]
MNQFKEINLKKLLDNARIGVVIHGLDTSVLYANPTALSLLKLTYDQLIGKDAMDPHWHFVDETGSTLPTEFYPVSRVAEMGETLNDIIYGVFTGEEKNISWFAVDAYREGGDEHNGFIIITFSDITERKSEFSFQAVVENAQDIVIVTEADTLDSPIGPKIVYVNKAFENISGYSAEEVMGETPRILQGKFTDEQSLKRVKNALKQQLPVRESILNYAKNGRPYWLDMNIIPLKNKYQQVTHFVAIERDITEQRFHAEQLEKRNQDLREIKENLQKTISTQNAELKNANLKLQRLAYYDFLTNLPNRRSFEDSAGKHLSLARRNKTLLLTGVVDLDDFKLVNDRFGHDTGDRILKMTADAMRQVFRREDAIGRLGGEEFAFVVQLEQQEDAIQICERLLQAIAEARYETADKNIAHTTASIGISVDLPTNDTTFFDLYNQADTALYKAKKTGKNCFILFSTKG